VVALSLLSLFVPPAVELPRGFGNVVAFEVTRRDISRTRASGGALAETRRCFVRFAAARQIDLEMKRLSSI